MSRTVNPMLRNRILHALGSGARKSLADKLDPVRLTQRETLYDIERPIEYVYFVLSGVVSVVAETDPTGVEVATIGNEGMVGIPAFLGADLASMRAFVQIPGEAMRMRVSHLRRLSGDASLMQTMHRYIQCFITQIAQNSACNRSHTLEERCARWLLLTHDRVDGDTFPLTQEFMGMMLGVRRASVSVAQGSLQSAGCIRYDRGSIDVTDRKGLERAACECYRIVREEYDRLLGAPDAPAAGGRGKPARKPPG